MPIKPGIQDDLSVQIALIVDLLHGKTPQNLSMIDKNTVRDYRYQREGDDDDRYAARFHRHGHLQQSACRLAAHHPILVCAFEGLSADARRTETHRQSRVDHGNRNAQPALGFRQRDAALALILAAAICV
jgi:hypothetical protein